MKEEEVRRAFREITDELRAMRAGFEVFEKARRGLSHEEAVRRIQERVRESTQKGRTFGGWGYGRGRRPREKSEEDPRLREADKKLAEKVREAAKKRRTSVRGG